MLKPTSKGKEGEEGAAGGGGGARGFFSAKVCATANIPPVPDNHGRHYGRNTLDCGKFLP